eukprot:5584738-Pyramimonas_sp.AAC.1
MRRIRERGDSGAAQIFDKGLARDLAFASRHALKQSKTTLCQGVVRSIMLQRLSSILYLTGGPTPHESSYIHTLQNVWMYTFLQPWGSDYHLPNQLQRLLGAEAEEAARMAPMKSEPRMASRLPTPSGTTGCSLIKAKSSDTPLMQ